MVSTLERAIRKHRNDIRSIDRSALARVYLAYQEIMERLNPQIELLQQAIRAKGDLTAPEVFRLQRYQELQRQIDTEMRLLAQRTGEITRQAQERAAVVALDNAETIAKASAATRAGAQVIATSWVRVPTSAVEDFIGAARSGPLADLLGSFGDVTAKTMVSEITNGLAMGKGPRVVADAIHKATEISRNRALLIARTEMLRSLRGASLTAYNANADILDGWYWTSAHQSRTCAACLSKDGSFHPLTETMESHPACRCAMRPGLKDVKQRPLQNGEAWLNEQSPEVQDQVLGKAGGKAFRAGEVELHDFVKVTESVDWGRSISDGGIGFARMNAERDRRIAA